MTARFLTVLLASVLTLSSAVGKVENFEDGPLPPDSVFDPVALPAPQVRKSIAEPLARIQIRSEQETKASRWRIAMLTGAACAIPLIMGVPALFLFFRKPGPRSFPRANPPPRLGAPHAGGNHAVADLGTAPSLKNP